MQNVEANLKLVRRDDGWRIQIVTDEGVTLEQDQPSFATREQAEAALDEWMEAHNVTEAMRAQ